MQTAAPGDAKSDSSNEKEISHGRVSWLARCGCFGHGTVGFMDWLDEVAVCFDEGQCEPQR